MLNVSIEPKFNYENMHKYIQNKLNETCGHKVHEQLGRDVFIDAYSSEDKYTLELETPGFSKADLSIFFKDNVFSVSGKRAGINEDRNYFVRERGLNKFKKEFEFMFEVDPESVSAEYENGVLKIMLGELESASESKEVKIN